MKEQKDKMITIVNNFGIRNQLKKLSEEVFELQEAVINYDVNNDKDNMNNIIEELADVTNLTNQIKHYYNIEESNLNDVLDYKVNRTLERIQSGYYNKSL